MIDGTEKIVVSEDKGERWRGDKRLSSAKVTTRVEVKSRFIFPLSLSNFEFKQNFVFLNKGQ